jgi:aconitate hydratase
MGIAPLQFKPGESVKSLGLTGREVFEITGLAAGNAQEVSVKATPEGGANAIAFTARLRIDTPKEREYYRHGGILQYVLRQLAGTTRAS